MPGDANLAHDSRISILVGGDICPTKGNARLFVEGDAPAVFGDLLPHLQSSDLAIANMECPLIERPSPAKKVGPTLGAPASCIGAIHKAGIGVLCLANNHIMDHGPQGLFSTLEACKAAGIETVGAGEDAISANKMLICERAGLRIGVLAMAEHEFASAGPSTPGANPIDIIDYVRTVRRQRSAVDHLLVLLHAGNEGYPYPRPSLMQLCRFMIEEGASVVVCQHSHCAGCVETYAGGYIVYGQGNLVFDPLYPTADSWYEGFLVSLEISGQDCHLELIPYSQSRGSVGARQLNGDEREAFLSGVKSRSEAIQDPGFIETQWSALCREKQGQYLANFTANTRLMRKLLKAVPGVSHLCDEESILLKLNLVRCESHRDVLIYILSMLSGNAEVSSWRTTHH